MGTIMPPFLQPMQLVGHRIQIQHDLRRVLGQTTDPQLQQASLDLAGIVGQLVGAGLLVIRKFQAVEGADTRQGYSAMRRVEPILSRRIPLVAGRGQ
jgi:hypothetical protein